MGSVISSLGSLLGGKEVVPVDTGETVARDLRRRNSMTFQITKFLTFEGDDYTPLLEMVREELENKILSINSNARDQSNIHAVIQYHHILFVVDIYLSILQSMLKLLIK